jgi:hypothetical protein
MGRKKIPVEISGNWQKKFNDSISRILDDAMDGHSENYPWYSSARNAHQLSLAVQVLTKNGYDMKSYLRGTKIDRSGKPIISKWVRKAESDLEICAEHALTGLIGRLQNWIHEANKDGSDEASRIFIDMYRFGVGLFNNVGILFIDTSTYAQTEKEYIGLGLVTKEKTKKIWRDMKESRGSAFDSIRKTLHNWSIDLQDWWSGY